MLVLLPFGVLGWSRAMFQLSGFYCTLRLHIAPNLGLHKTSVRRNISVTVPMDWSSVPLFGIDCATHVPNPRAENGYYYGLPFQERLCLILRNYPCRPIEKI